MLVGTSKPNYVAPDMVADLCAANERCIEEPMERVLSYHLSSFSSSSLFAPINSGYSTSWPSAISRVTKQKPCFIFLMNFVENS